MIHDAYAQSRSALLTSLNTQQHRGLNVDEAKRRHGQEGPNTLPRRPSVHPMTIVFEQFRSALVLVLIAAAVVSFALNESTDAFVILFAVGVNVVVGFIQEYKAQRSLEDLQSFLTVHARVRRGGEHLMIPAEELVVGDVILVEAGDTVPADARLLTGIDLLVNEAPLTGESEPQKKGPKTLSGKLVIADQANMIFLGTFIAGGKGEALVVAIGTHTEMGKIALLMQETPEGQTPLQKQLQEFSVGLTGIILVICALILAVGLWNRMPFGEMFRLSVSIAVAAIPEGLAIAVTVVLAIGMRRILKKNALVRRLVSAETLGSTTVICTDKTGTLTEGKMTLTNLITWDHDLELERGRHASPKIDPHAAEALELALRIGVLCNNAVVKDPTVALEAVEVHGNPTESALLFSGWQIGLKRELLEKETPRIAEMPFTSDLKMMATLHKFNEHQNILYVKGAPERLLALSKTIHAKGTHLELTAERRKTLLEKFERLSAKGYRILAVAYERVPSAMREINQERLAEQALIFLGYVVLQDPLRATVKQTISDARRAGIHVVMMTGDHPLTARAIARQLGIPATAKNMLEGSALAELSETDLRRRVKDITVYARVTPQDKLRIVAAWQASGEVVAMTGDGVNDAPALKAADIGVALGSGTDVSKSAADLVLLDNHFRTIVEAVRQGRVIFDNLKKVTLYLLSDSFSEVTLITGALLLGLPLPLLPTQILWINIVTDGFPHIALTQEPVETAAMSERPSGRRRAILDRFSRTLILAVSVVSGLGNLLLFYVFERFTGDVALARTVVFAALGLDSLLYVFSLRSLRRPFFQQSFFSNPLLLIAVAAGFVLQLAVLYIPFLQSVFHTVPLGWAEWIAVGGMSLAVVGVVELVKFLRPRQDVLL